MIGHFFKRKSSSTAVGYEKTVYLHIGISKTGTTTIQKFLHTHKELLQSVGVHYISAGRNSGGESHHRLARIYKSGADSAEVAQEIFKEITDSNCRSFVISSEMFEYLDNKGIARFKEDLRGLNLVLVVYLRYQDQAISSMYNELVKKHACAVGFSEHISKTPRKGLLLYGKMLARWAKALGRNNIRARIFDSDRFYRGDLIKDFLKTVGAPKLDIDTSSSYRNEAVSDAAVEILAEINKLMDYSIDHARHYGLACRLSGKLNRIIQEKFPDQASSSSNFFASVEEYELFMTYYNRDNYSVSKKYLNGELFRPRNYVPKIQMTDAFKRMVLIALAEELRLRVDVKNVSTKDLIFSIATYWSSELRRFTKEHASW